MNNTEKFKGILKGFIIGLLMILFLFLSFKAVFGQRPTKSEVYYEIVNQDILYPDIVWKQAWLESHCGKNRNNLFGFRYKGIDGKYHLKTYKSWKESIKNYKKWQDKWFSYHIEHQHSDGSICNYYHFLQCIKKNKYDQCTKYASYDGYISRLKQISMNL